LASAGSGDPFVKKLTVWRNNYFAHRSRSSALDPKGFASQHPMLFSEIEALIDNGLRVVNRYSSIFSATVHTSLPIKDYKHLLDAVRRDLERQETQMQQYRAAAKARAR
jgi:HEPN superfamily AbiU2-like protein